MVIDNDKRLTMMRFFFALAFLVGAANAVHAQSSHLWNDGAGNGQCLDIVNDGHNDKLTVTGCGNFSGQAWTLLPTDQPGHYRLQTAFTGAARCLDVINDGVNDRVRMSSCANVSGQFWELTRLRRHGRAFQLTNLFTGPSRCLAASAEGLHLRACDRSPDQQWSSEWTISG
jgi:hypothetical protein